jgi:hypothetical protein
MKRKHKAKFTVRCHLCTEPIRELGTIHDCPHGHMCRAVSTTNLAGRVVAQAPACPECRALYQRQAKLPGVK